MSMKHRSGEDGIRLLNERLAEVGLRRTARRSLVARILFSAPGHVGVDDLIRMARLADRRIGKATVYRTVRLLCRLGLASERRFGNGRAVFEPLEPRRRHDHMVCERCGSATEFRSGEIERLQERIAGEKGFRITRRRLDLYGICSRCARGKDGDASSLPPDGA